MLKIVPDPPLPLHSLEDTIMLASEYALCAEAVRFAANPLSTTGEFDQ